MITRFTQIIPFQVYHAEDLRSPRHQVISSPTKSPPGIQHATNHLATKKLSRHQPNYELSYWHSYIQLKLMILIQNDRFPFSTIYKEHFTRRELIGQL